VQKRFNLNIDWCDADEIRKVVPGINPEGLIGGTFSPDDAQVNPLLASESFTSEAKSLGAVFHYRESVRGFIMEGNRITAVKTDQGTYRAEHVVNAAGAHATQVCEMAGLRIPVNPDSHEGGISAPVKPFLGPLVVDLRPGPEGKTSNFYFGQNHEGAIIFCYTPREIFPGENRISTSEFMPIIARRLVTLIPRFKHLMIRRIWRGLYPMTPDALPVVGKPRSVENLYLAIGMCGQGFMLGPGVGINIASLICRGKPAIDPEVFATLSPDREFTGKKEELK
jgi:sarcosine oxidase subunit beta